MKKELSLKKFGVSMFQLLCFVFIIYEATAVFLRLIGFIDLNVFLWCLEWFTIILWSGIYADTFLLKD